MMGLGQLAWIAVPMCFIWTGVDRFVEAATFFLYF